MTQGGLDLFALIGTVWSAVMAGQVPPEEVLKLLLSKARHGGRGIEGWIVSASDAGLQQSLVHQMIKV